MSRRVQRFCTKARSAADSSAGRMPWSTWAALRPTPRALCFAVLAVWRVRSRATESAPPEMATQMRSPGWMCVRSKARVGAAGMQLLS